MYARVATFEGGDGAKAAAEIRTRNEADGGPPPGLPAKKLMILDDAEAKRTMAITFFESEEDYRQGDETLNSMTPPSGDDDMGERVAVEKFEVALELEV